MRTWLVGAALLSISTFSSLAAAYGEEKAGFPNWSERVIHQWSNRARSDPATELQGCAGNDCAERACYSAIAPLVWNEALNRAARFHAHEMIAQNFFDHASRCTIDESIKNTYPTTCQGTVACACKNGSQTCSGECPGPADRMDLFGIQGGAENIYSDSGNDPVAAFKTWIFERSSTTACEFTLENGHRWNILKNEGSLGVGVVKSGKHMAVMDFSGQRSAGSKIPSGSHHPRQAASVDVWANWQDGARPKTAAVQVDGACVPMTKKRGSDTNGAYSATLTNVASGCHRYFFRFTDSTNAIVDYPTTGTLGIGPQGTCADWQDGAHAACGGGGGDGGGGGGGDGGGGGGGDGGGGGGGGGGDRDAGAGAGGDGGVENGASDLFGGGCAIGPRETSFSLMGLAGSVLALSLARRRRRV